LLLGAIEILPRSIRSKLTAERKPQQARASVAGCDPVEKHGNTLSALIHAAGSDRRLSPLEPGHGAISIAMQLGADADRK
jgi:hypothetical protein